ncbi:MAG: sulfatase [Gemmatimonadota bacterium]
MPEAGPRLPERQILLIATASWLAAVTAHLLIFVWKTRITGGHWPNATADMPYLAPLGYFAFFAPFTAITLVLNRVVPARVGARLVPSLLISLSAVAVLLHNDRLHPAALLVVAIGIGVRLSAGFAVDATRAWRRTRIMVLVSGVFVLGLALETLGRRVISGWRLDRSRGEAVAGSTDVILLILDTVRAKSLSAYGYHQPTSPHLSELAKGGVLFENAFSVAPWSAPSHASMLTGLWGGATGADYLSPMHESAPTISLLLNERGYRSAAFMANGSYSGRGLRLDRGFDHFEDFRPGLAQGMAATTLGRLGSSQLLIRGIRSRKAFMMINALRHPDLRFRQERPLQSTTAEVVGQFWKWRDANSDRPYFVMMNLMDAHAPYEPPGGFATMFDSGRTVEARYLGAIAYLDSIVQSLVDGLRRRDPERLARTLFVVTSDHGEQFGEHGIHRHGNSAYLPVLHVPLILWGAGVPAGPEISDQVSLRDLAATMRDLTGTSDPALPGVSLRKVWSTGSNAGASPVLVEASKIPNPSEESLLRFGALRSAIDSTWHYILNGDGSEQVFTWRSDTAEMNNLIETPEGRAAADRLLALIRREFDGSATPAQPARSP